MRCLADGPAALLVLFAVHHMPAVVLWDLSEVLDDTLTCAFMKQVC